MKRVILSAGLLLSASMFGGCCHLWESIHYWEDCLCCECGPGVHGCNWGWGDYTTVGHSDCSGCGGCYHGEWHTDAGCDPCDCAGNWIGPGYGTVHSAPGYATAERSGVVASQSEHSGTHERSVIVAEEHDHATPQRLR